MQRLNLKIPEPIAFPVGGDRNLRSLDKGGKQQDIWEQLSSAL